MGAVLDRSQTRWRAVLNTPNLPAVWADLRSGLGIVVRMDHGRPEDLACVGAEFGLPDLPNIKVRLLRAPNLSRLAERPAQVLREETLRHLGAAEPQHGKR